MVQSTRGVVLDFYIKIFSVYIILVNVIAAFVCILDKHRAKHNGRRISEKTLFTLCFIGGGFGMYFTKLRIRHKTLQKRFMIGIPLIILLQLAVVLMILTKFGK